MSHELYYQTELAVSTSNHKCWLINQDWIFNYKNFNSLLQPGPALHFQMSTAQVVVVLLVIYHISHPMLKWTNTPGHTTAPTKTNTAAMGGMWPSWEWQCVLRYCTAIAERFLPLVSQRFSYRFATASRPSRTWVCRWENLKFVCGFSNSINHTHCMRQGSMRTIIESNTEAFLRRRLTGGKKIRSETGHAGYCWKWPCDSSRHKAFFVSSVISLDLGLQYGFCSHAALKDLSHFDPA